MDESQPSQTEKKRTVNARWISSTTLTFCDICIQAIEKGLRPETHFTSKGWSIVVNSFNEVSGENYDKAQLKNKWDNLRTNWKLWKQLIGKETGLSWDPKKKTIDASADWWNEKLKVLPSAAKFRKEGLEPELVDRLDIMFSDTVATGEYARTPSSFVQIDENMQALSDEVTINMEGGGDSTEEDFEKSIDDTMQNSGKDMETSTESKRKRNLGKAKKG